MSGDNNQPKGLYSDRDIPTLSELLDMIASGDEVVVTDLPVREQVRVQELVQSGFDF